ncbi:MAG: hypothetical protein V1744_02060 [Candidatus Altiarchaeota archaeon]
MAGSISVVDTFKKVTEQSGLPSDNELPGDMLKGLSKGGIDGKGKKQKTPQQELWRRIERQGRSKKDLEALKPIILGLDETPAKELNQQMKLWEDKLKEENAIESGKALIDRIYKGTWNSGVIVNAETFGIGAGKALEMLREAYLSAIHKTGEEENKTNEAFYTSEGVKSEESGKRLEKGIADHVKKEYQRRYGSTADISEKSGKDRRIGKGGESTRLEAMKDKRDVDLASQVASGLSVADVQAMGVEVRPEDTQKVEDILKGLSTSPEILELVKKAGGGTPDSTLILAKVLSALQSRGFEQRKDGLKAT